MLVLLWESLEPGVNFGGQKGMAAPYHLGWRGSLSPEKFGEVQFPNVHKVAH